MLTDKVETLFSNYLTAFIEYDIEQIRDCYNLPCTLHTPDKVVLIKNDVDFDREFLEIFLGLQAASVQKIVPLQSTYSKIGADLFLVCIDWAFYNVNNEIYADFSALYYLNTVHKQLRIFNVASHDIDNALPLTTQFTIKK